MKKLFEAVKNKLGLQSAEEAHAPAAPAQVVKETPVAAASDHTRYLPAGSAPLAMAAVKEPEASVEIPVKEEKEVESVGQIPAARASFFPETKERRERITRFIVQSLMPYVDEAGVSIHGIKLFIRCNSNAEKEQAKIALYADKPGFYRAEKLQRKLENNFIQLSPGWSFHYELVTGDMPPCIFKEGEFGLDVLINQQRSHQRLLARLQVLTGQTALADYVLDSSASQRYCIGRGFQPQLASGKIHTNDIVFLNRDDAGFDEKKGSVNAYISRDHAVIAFNPAFNKFLLYADKGGLPENGNKTKIFKANNQVERVDIAGIGHELSNGDQIELGAGAKLLFLEEE
ncbi:MAG TPA: hypothetical protein VL307_01550 [Chitinophagaceae bacterium]|nr:hypothetical protein [Chitinophagaceae bacterium]